MITAQQYTHEFISRFVPYLNWIQELKDPAVVWKDCVAGLTVALVLIPQSMAYAQLAGLPPYYGLYASFLPVIVASTFGSSRQLQTGPVAVVSLMTAAALEPLAAANPEGFVVYAAILAILVGVFQMSLGLLRLGVLVDFLSHPVVVGFTNAAAIIIATSQLSKLFWSNCGKPVTISSSRSGTCWSRPPSTLIFRRSPWASWRWSSFSGSGTTPRKYPAC